MKSTLQQNERFSHDLELIKERVDSHKTTIADLETILKNRGPVTLSLILSIPFVQPIPVPGLSIIFGIIIALFGVRLARGTTGGLPQFIGRREVDAELIRKLFTGLDRVFRMIERFVKPRWSLAMQPPFITLIGISMVTSGIALALPLPPVILFSNSIPAWSIILLCLGYLERDGVLITLGYMMAVFTWCYLAFWGEAIKFAFLQILDHYAH